MHGLGATRQRIGSEMGANSSDLITDIYRSILTPDHLQELLERVAHHCGADGAALFYFDSVHLELDAVFERRSRLWDRSFLAEYTTHLWDIDPTMEILSRRDALSLVTPSTATREERRLIAPWAEKFASRLNIGAYMGARLNDGATWFDGMTLQLLRENAGAAERAARRLATLLPHLATALEISRPFALLRHRFNAMLAVLDRIQVGVMILDERGRVVVYNQRAEEYVTDGNGLRLLGGYLRQDETGRASDALPAAIQEALAVATRTDQTRRRYMTIEKRRAATPYIVEISPLTDDDNGLGLGFRGAVVLIIDPDKLGNVDTTGIATAFKLTPAEQAVCALLLDGLTNTEIADARNVSTETVKRQLSSLLQKIGVGNRTGLVRKALSASLPVDGADAKD